VGTLDPRALFEYLVQSRGIAVDGELETGSGELDIMSTSSSPKMNEDGNDERLAKWQGRPASGGRGGTCTVNNTFFGM